MTALEKLTRAMERLGVDVWPIVARYKDTETLPDDYIVITPIMDDPEYAGDEVERYTSHLRASWYSKTGNTGHKAAMRKEAATDGFAISSSADGFGAEMYVAHQEFWAESEEE